MSRLFTCWFVDRFERIVLHLQILEQLRSFELFLHCESGNLIYQCKIA
jgi:hypothetical protein